MENEDTKYLNGDGDDFTNFFIFQNNPKKKIVLNWN